MNRKAPSQKQYLRALQNHITRLQKRLGSCPLESHKEVEQELVRAKAELQQAQG